MAAEGAGTVAHVPGRLADWAADEVIVRWVAGVGTVAHVPEWPVGWVAA